MVGTTIINHEILKAHLCRSPDRDETEVNKLMNPTNAQDVLCAIEFINTIDAISSHPLTDVRRRQSRKRRLLVFSAFIDFFICPKWILTQ